MSGCFPCLPAALHRRLKSSRTIRSVATVQKDILEVLQHCEDPEVLEDVLLRLEKACGGKVVRKFSDDPTPRVRRTNTVIMALNGLRDLPARIGLDIGGTLAKMVYLQAEGSDEGSLPDRFGKSGQRHAELALLIPGHVDPQGDETPTLPRMCHLHFISGETERLRRALENPTGAITTGETRKIVVSGGGAHRFADAFKTLLNVDFVPFQEMESLVQGLEFLHESSPRGEVFTWDEDGVERTATWPMDCFPCLLVNIGSGVSILRIDGRESPKAKCRYTRLGGTACGGATFLGLMQFILANESESYEHALELVDKGDTTKVNTLVQDIYGVNGCANLGLPPQMNAAYFGKLIGAHGHIWDKACKEDLAAALMTMVVQESVVLARAFSMATEIQFGRPPPVFFVGGFLAGNTFGQKIISKTWLRFKMSPPLFLKHADFLGAIGALAYSLDQDDGW